MTMHLVKPYLSTTRYNIRKPKLSPRDIKAKKEHEKFLRQMGVGKSIGTESVAEMPTYSRPVDDVKLSNKITGGGYKRSFQEQQDRYEVSSQYSIGPAYNKGGYQVLSKEDQKDPATGKRR
tara:strand:- start:1148 stop:1510 length:363 start_codon:yes stop_codon:yes gene_type:complete